MFVAWTLIGGSLLVGAGWVLYIFFYLIVFSIEDRQRAAFKPGHIPPLDIPPGYHAYERPPNQLIQTEPRSGIV